MDPAVWKSAKFKAWAVGGGLGILGAIVSSVLGLFGGMCCLFTFANAIVPVVLGVVGGGAAAFLADWSAIPADQAVSSGAMLGLRGGGFAAIMAGLLGFTFALLWPVVMGIIQAASAGDDIVAMLVATLVSVAVGAIMSAVLMGGGVIVGLLFGAGTGAVVGMMRGQK